MEKSKGNKASNIYQVLKGSGAWQSKDSKGPMIKGVGIKSPLNLNYQPDADKPNSLESADPKTAGVSKEIREKAQQMYKDKTGPYAPKKGKKTATTKTKTSYKDAYKKRDMKTYGELTEAEYIAEAKRQNKSKKETGKWDAPKKQMVSKKKEEDKDQNKVADPEGGTTEGGNTEGGTTEGGTNVAADARKEVAATNKAKRKARKAENKAKRKAKKAANQQKRADRIKKEGGTKVGNFLRKAVGKGKKVVEKVVNKEEEESPAKLVPAEAKKKIKKYLKKEVQPKLKAIEAVNEAGLVIRKHLKKKKKSPVKLVEGEHDWKKDLNSKNLTESLTSLAKKYPKTAEALKNKGITPENAPKKIEEGGKKVLKKGHDMLSKFMSKINK